MRGKYKEWEQMRTESQTRHKNPQGHIKNKPLQQTNLWSQPHKANYSIKTQQQVVKQQ